MLLSFIRYPNRHEYYIYMRCMMKKKCDKHPKYKGKRKPKYQCESCLKLYLLLHKAPRALHRPTKVIPDKTKYNRKRDKGVDYD